MHYAPEVWLVHPCRSSCITVKLKPIGQHGRETLIPPSKHAARAVNFGVCLTRSITALKHAARAPLWNALVAVCFIRREPTRLLNIHDCASKTSGRSGGLFLPNRERRGWGGRQYARVRPHVSHRIRGQIRCRLTLPCAAVKGSKHGLTGNTEQGGETHRGGTHKGRGGGGGGGNRERSAAFVYGVCTYFLGHHLGSRVFAEREHTTPFAGMGDVTAEQR